MRGSNQYASDFSSVTALKEAWNIFMMSEDETKKQYSFFKRKEFSEVNLRGKHLDVIQRERILIFVFLRPSGRSYYCDDIRAICHHLQSGGTCEGECWILQAKVGPPICCFSRENEPLVGATSLLWILDLKEGEMWHGQDFVCLFRSISVCLDFLGEKPQKKDRESRSWVDHQIINFVSWMCFQSLQRGIWPPPKKLTIFMCLIESLGPRQTGQILEANIATNVIRSTHAHSVSLTYSHKFSLQPH